MIIWPRLLFGFIVLICAEVFSGASVKPGLWQPWTWIVTYWLYFAHFFLFTTLAVRTGRTSLGALYLWGVLFGLYESWITKVIWYGYGNDGKLVLGHLGPYGFGELSMVFLFHPVMSFLLPLAVACLLCPNLRAWFPDLAWLTGTSRLARIVRGYVAFACATTLGMNAGGPVHLLLNLALLFALLFALLRLARAGLAASDGRSLVVFGQRGLIGLCVYLAALYGLTYFHLIPAGLPSVLVQLATLAFYAVPIAGLWLHQQRAPLPATENTVAPEEMRRVLVGFATVLGGALVLSIPAVKQAVFVAIVVHFVLWTPLGMVLTVAALWRGWRDRQGNSRLGATPAV